MLYTPISRRTLIQLTGLATLGGTALSLQACSKQAKEMDLQLYLVAQDQKLTFILPRSEMGQDIVTTFAMAITEELDAPLDLIEVKIADASPEIPNQMTVGSSSVRSWWTMMRHIGANTRALLLELAKQLTQKPLSELQTDNGFVSTADASVKLPYSALLKDIQIPGKVENAPLKKPEHFTILGTSQKSLWTGEKVTGAFSFLADHRDETSLSLMSVSYKKEWPKPGEALLEHIKTQHKLTFVFTAQSEIGSADFRVFLCHDKTWPLLKAKEALESQKRKTLKNLPTPGSSELDIESETSSATNTTNAKQIALTYQTPAIPQAPMEPPCGRIKLSRDQVEVWAPTQAPDHAQKAIAKQLNFEIDQVTLHTVPMGGAFGRKRYSDYLEELAQAAQILLEQNVSRPLTLIWTREDDLGRELYRPATVQVVKWDTTRPETLEFSVYEGYAGAQNPEPNAISTDLPLGLEVAAQRSYRDHYFSSGIWRSVYHGYHAFALCSSIDEICHQLEQDPLTYYLDHPKSDSLKSRVKALLSGDDTMSERMSIVIDRVKQLASWPADAAAGSGLGFAAYSVFGSHIALIAQVRIEQEKQLKIDQVWASVDCGRALNPDGVKAQVEGGILYGLSACLYGAVPTDKDKMALNFDNMPVLKIADSPSIEIDIVNSEAAPTGAGELGVPVIAPAVCNAIRSLTPYRFTKLPLIKESRINYDNAYKVLAH